MRRPVVLLALALALVLALGACGSVSEDYAETGVDELVIPTPSPDPEDFVGYVDNPLLALERGHEWTYDVEDGVTSGTSTVTVEPSNLLLGGVEVTVVRTVTTLGTATPTETTDYYAQDRAGNVWWFGRAGVWDVEYEGARAGLAMPADPRIGDGWRLALLDGVVEDRVTVTEVEDGKVVLELESDLDPGLRVEREYAPDIGLVRTLNLEGPVGSSELSAGP